MKGRKGVNICSFITFFKSGVTEVAKLCKPVSESLKPTISHHPLELPNFRKYAYFYGLFNREKDYAGESGYVAGLIRQFGAPGKLILDLGCGTGGHAVELMMQGFDVQGIERSADMAEIARERGVNCEVGDICILKLPGKFDVVVSLFLCIELPY